VQSSTVEVPNLFPGDHDVKVFHHPENRWDTSEFWAELTISLDSGNNDWSIRRNQPFILDTELIHPVTGSAVLELEQNDPFQVRSRVKNPSGEAKEVRVWYVYATDPAGGKVQGPAQVATATLAAGETMEIEWNQTFSDVGQYHDAVMVETLGDDWQTTGSTDWRLNGLSIRTKTPGEFANVSPGNNAAYFTNQLLEQLDWTASTPVTSYDVYLDKDNPTPTTKVASGLTEPNWAVDVPLTEGIWYWKIIARNDDASREGAVWRFNVLTPTTEPDPLQPGNPIFISGQEMTLLPIKEGTFVMGSPVTELDRTANEGPLTTVTINDHYWLGQTEVTIDQFRQYLLDGGDKAGVNFSAADCPINDDAQFSLRGNAFGSDGQQPMVHINWSAAVAYCEWLTRQANGQELLM